MVKVYLKSVLKEKGITQKELCKMIHARPSTATSATTMQRA